MDPKRHNSKFIQIQLEILRFYLDILTAFLFLVKYIRTLFISDQNT